MMRCHQKEASVHLTPRQIASRRLVRNWLYIIFLLLIAIVLVGGATRMTGSGLSITEWQPIHGVIPPVGHMQWQEEFEKYQQIAQYQRVNRGMTLEEFKHIFWWEWAHRLLARVVLGLFVALPLVFFWVTGRLERTVQWRLLGILLLGGFQGVIGWWMVSSGLDGSQLTSVSQYRLAIHLVTACLIIIAVLALARRLAADTAAPASRGIQHFAGWLVFLVLVQIYLGALVAGLHAGKSYNTWPLMDGQFVPDGLLVMQPWRRNLFENTLTVQFIHRCFAYFLLAAAVVHTLLVEKQLPETLHARRSVLLLVLIVVQAFIGIITLLTEAPLGWGLLHQGFALVVLSFSVAHWAGCKGALHLLR